MKVESVVSYSIGKVFEASGRITVAIILTVIGTLFFLLVLDGKTENPFGVIFVASSLIFTAFCLTVGRVLFRIIRYGVDFSCYFEGLALALEKRIQRLHVLFTDKNANYRRIMKTKGNLDNLKSEWSNHLVQSKVAEIDNALEQLNSIIAAIGNAHIKVNMLTEKLKSIAWDIREKKKIYLLSLKTQKALRYTSEKAYQDMRGFFDKLAIELNALPQLQSDIRQIREQMEADLAGDKTADQLADIFLQIEEETKLVG